MPFNAFPIDTTPFTDFEFLGENRTQLRTQPERIGDVVNVAEFNGFSGDGISDDIAPLRAAVAAALSEGKQTILIPDGAECLISEPLFVGDVGTPTNSNFSINLMGEGGTGQITSTIGSTITASFDDDVAIKFGPGQNCSCQNLFIKSSVSANHPLLLDPAGAGLGIAGGAGGAAGFVASRVMVRNFYTAFQVDYNNFGSLAEHMAFDECEARVCAIGLDIPNTQNREISVTDCRLNATIGIHSWSSPVNVRGGQFGSELQESATLTINTVSALTRTTTAKTISYYDFPAGGTPVSSFYTFTMVVDSPTVAQEALLAVNGYGAMGIDTASYGVVPVCPVSYDTGTNVLTVIVWPYWSMGSYGGLNIKTGTTIETELQAATSLYVAEWVQFFVGNGFNISGIHCEQANALVTAVGQITGGSGGGPSSYIQASFGWPIAHGNLAANNPVRKLQQVFPFFLQNTSADLIIDRSTNQEGTGEKVIVDFYGVGDSRISMSNSSSFVGHINERVMFNSNAGSEDANINYANTTCRAFGGLYSDRTIHTVYPNSVANSYTAGWVQSPCLGSRPMLYVAPQVASSLLAMVTTGAVGSFPLLWGGQSYRLQTWSSGAPVQPWTIGDFVGMTYGRDFDGAPGNFSAVTFDAIGSSNIIALSDTTMAKAGWVLVLNNGAVDNLYICTGIWPDEGFISVCRIDADGTTNCGFNGTAGTSYTGNVKQQPYTLTNYP